MSRSDVIRLAMNIRSQSEQLLAEMKESYGELTLPDAKYLYRTIDEVRGWLLGARDLLDPEQMIGG